MQPSPTVNSSIKLVLSACLAGLVLASLACGSDLKLPVNRIKTGRTQTDQVRLPMPDSSAGDVELRLEFAGGKLQVSPGASGYLVEGTATYNVAEFEPIAAVNGGSTTLSSGDLEMEGFPIFTDEVVNAWDLKLADTLMSLEIQAGGYEGTLELGGLALNKLAISDGGASVKGTFSSPNKVEMSSFTYSTGASSAQLTGLANANFAQMSFTSGAGDYTLSFDGDLQRDASVTIESGVGSLTIIVPKEVKASVSIDSGLTTVNIDGGWAQDGSVYTAPGAGPTLTIAVKMGLGTLNLKID